MNPDRLGEVIPDRHQGVEARERILEHHADVASTDAFHAGAGERVDALAVQPDLAAGDAAGRGDLLHDGGARDGFAGSGFADESEHLARTDVERDPVEADQEIAARRKFDPQVAYRKDRVRHLGSRPQRSFGLRASRSQSPRRLRVSTRMASAKPGKATIHHSPENRYSCPMRISVPSDGRMGGRPTPR